MAKKRTKIRVFLADDHEMVREGLAALLGEEEDFEVAGQCGDGLEVVPGVAKCHPDVVLLDVAMPGLNGLDVCRELVAKMPGVAVLIVSAHKNRQFVARGLKYGAAGYLVKDVAVDSLAEAIRTVAAGEPYIGPGITRDILQQVARGDQDNGYELLSNREREVLQLIAEGLTSPRIAERLGIASKTVGTHRERLMRKLGIHGQTALVKYAVTKGLISLD